LVRPIRRPQIGDDFFCAPAGVTDVGHDGRRFLPRLFRDIVLAGGYRIARMFGLSARMIQLWVAYRKLAGPRLPVRTEPVVLERVGSGVPRYAPQERVGAKP
jgi:hypothetical protein